MTFEELQLIPQLLNNVKKSGYSVPTPIQEQTIPLVLSGRDVLGCAQTGTGKTAAFALPMIQNLVTCQPKSTDARVIKALILTPTRELAQQIFDNFVMYVKGLNVRMAVVFGGVNQQGQIEKLHQGADVVIACPGRLLDLMGQGFVRLDFVKYLVLDEADRMLDMGFIHDVRKIVGNVPSSRQTLLFSATMPKDVEELALEMLKKPVSVKVNPVSSTVDKIDQCLYYVDKANKKKLLAHLLNEKKNDSDNFVIENALVFSRTRHGADRIVRDLAHDGISAVAIHGDKTQYARQSALKGFKNGSIRVLVATDIAARGIDVKGISHVINYDLPEEPESYVHRIGRTGRAGLDGCAISFCCIDEIKWLGQIEKLIKKNIREKKSPWPMEVTTPTQPKTAQASQSRLSMQNKADIKAVDKNGNPAQTRKTSVHFAQQTQSRSRRSQPANQSVKAGNSRQENVNFRRAQKNTENSAATIGKPVQRVNRHRKG